MPVLSTQFQVINRVPSDVWFTILKHCDCWPSDGGFADGGHTPVTQRYRTHSTLTSVSHVCQALRAVALSTPLFWTRISLCIGDHTGSDTPTTPRLQLIRLFLERSQEMPLYVTLSIGRLNLLADSEEYKFLIDFFSTVKRWRHAEIELDPEWIDEQTWQEWWDLTVRNATPLPLLEYLEVRTSATEDHLRDTFLEVLKLPVDLWRASPSLTHLAISVRELDPQPEELAGLNITPSDLLGWVVRCKIPYAQITHLLLEGGPSTHISWSNIWEIFSNSPNLIVCFLDGICSDPTQPLSAVLPVVVPHLRHLYFEASGLDGFYESLTAGLNSVLTAPALLTLALAYGEDRDEIRPLHRQPSELAPYAEFIARSSCSLTELRLIELDIPVNQLLAFMELSPTLQLVHCNFELTPHTLTTFSSRMEERRSGDGDHVDEFVLCPRLREFGLYFCNYVAEGAFSTTRFTTLRQEESTARRTEKIWILAIYDPYYEEEDDPVTWDEVYSALSTSIRAPARVEIIYLYYRVLQTTRRSLWNRFRYEK